MDNLQIGLQFLTACGHADEAAQLEPATFTDGNLSLLLAFVWRLWKGRLAADGVDSLLGTLSSCVATAVCAVLRAASSSRALTGYCGVYVCV